MTLPRTLVKLSPFIALLGGIVGLGQLFQTVSLPPFAARGFLFSVLHWGGALVAGILWTAPLGDR